ncbi:PREDICTED: cyclin-dependent kinases regulatory subunit-like isoform X1 [Dinoponera quadriceps]|uniref:Cyclin-dependent kinases regulatory subunit n=1 Tax=Dinoponera quadriceps TaxID=609295 RepID=A0A6P3WN83_DINQU|nr:PREDICTED: cyclin-dependent kinases regulatory subunit-like isoform X1 [Dinoponera quadriceps]
MGESLEQLGNLLTIITRKVSRHVILPPDIARHVPKTHLITETEWRNLGVQQSPGWVHYMMHGPEPHVLLFRRLRSDLETPRRIPQTEEIISC